MFGKNLFADCKITMKYLLLVVLIVHIQFWQFTRNRCVRLLLPFCLFPFLPQFILGEENQQMLRSLSQFITPRKLKQDPFIEGQIFVAAFYHCSFIENKNLMKNFSTKDFLSNSHISQIADVTIGKKEEKQTC